MLFIKIAWRNILRNPRRSLVTVSTVAFGLAALIFLWGFVDGAHQKAIDKTIDVFTGHLSVSAKGFFKKMSMDMPLPDREKVSSMLSNMKEVQSFTERIVFPALVGTVEKSRSVVVFAVDPVNEPRVTTLNKSMVQGLFLEGSDESSLLLPKPIAEDLKVKLGKKVVLLGQGADGSLVGEALRLKGVFETKSSLDDAYVMLSLKKAQQLFALDDNVFQVIVRLKKHQDLNAIKQELLRQLGDRYEVLTWREQMRGYAEMLDYEDAVVSLISLVFLIVVAAGIMNTMLMAVMERTREFGIVTALGTKPSQLVLCVSLETIMISSVGIIAGTALGTLVVYVFSHVGIDLSHFSSAETVRALEGKVYTSISMKHFLSSIIVSFMTAILMSAYPAWKATRMDPIQAIRQF